MRHRNLACVMFLLLGSNLMSCKPSEEPVAQPKEPSATATTPFSDVVTPTKQNDSKPSDVELNSWLKATPEMRDRMAEKMISDGSLLGKVEDEVEAVLGKPDFRSERMIYSFEFGEKFAGFSAPSLILNLDCEGLVETAGQASYPRSMTAGSFDEQKWKNGTDQERFYMAPTLAKSKRLIGMSSESAATLLGEPSKRTLPQIAYYSRPRKKGGPAPSSPNRKLLIKFNESRQVDKVIYTQQ